MATSTYKTFLMKKADSTYAKLVDIKDFPNMMDPPEQLETTTLSEGARTYILGIQEQGVLQFTANYDATNYTAVANSATADESAAGDYAIWFGATVSGGVATPTGSEGKFEFKGVMAQPTILGKGVNEVREIQITLAPTTPIVKASS